MTTQASRFQRYLLPGLAFKSAVIGGGYATGRELAEFFLPSGPWGGLAAMTLSMVVWSVVCILTFLLARAIRAYDYRSFFQHLLGRGWWTFEVAYLALIVVVLAVFGAAAGELASTMFDWPRLVGTLLLVVVITAVVRAGTTAVERLFKLMSLFMYVVYALAACLILFRFGDDAMARMSSSSGLGPRWALDGLTYAGYNVFAAVSTLIVVRHLLCRRDAVVAGALAGPLAIVPAMVFYVCMLAFLPDIADAPLPSDVMLGKLGLPWFQWLFRLMIMVALLETGVALMASVDARIRSNWRERTGTEPGTALRTALVAAILLGAVFLADAIGLVALIAKGYRLLAYAVLATYVVPLLLYASKQLWTRRGDAFGPAVAPSTARSVG
ncbi:hypothetical protein MNO14_08415 [Luteimonas sp. S4-F44]|uniref:YkvI family membrane protein n=1 Tax=Luteimonas sp. S4-F44 TaxID=2925842 RepID=UPI001F533D8B|nr:hypothetical protein [Luteimonas sp. S4-F44]UNK41016.1 hypothetical protein MNO14_08415 [Luteimonas sp. S4-F44]